MNKLNIDKLKNVPCNLSNLKSKLDKLDVGKLVPVSTDLSKFSDVVKMILKRLIIMDKLKKFIILKLLILVI